MYTVTKHLKHLSNIRCCLHRKVTWCQYTITISVWNWCLRSNKQLDQASTILCLLLTRLALWPWRWHQYIPLKHSTRQYSDTSQMAVLASIFNLWIDGRTTQIKKIWQALSNRAEEAGFDSWQEKEIFVSSIVPRLAVRLTHAPVQLLPVALCSDSLFYVAVKHNN
jgi:hypothetical protein